MGWDWTIGYPPGLALMLGLTTCLLCWLLAQRNLDPVALQRISSEFRDAFAPLFGTRHGGVLGLALGAVTFVLVIIPLGLIFLTATVLGSVIRMLVMGPSSAR